MTSETIGLIFILIQIIAASFQPVFTKLIVGTINPIFAAAIVSLIGSLIPIVFLLKNRRLKVLFSRENLSDLLLIGFLGTTVTYLMFFYGASLTSGTNTSILLAVEPVYSIILGYVFLKEKISSKQVFVTMLIIAGVVSVIYRGTATLNLGDILILLTPLFYQLSFIIAKKTIEKIGTFAVSAGRYLFAGLTLFVISSFSGMNQFNLLSQPVNLIAILVLGLLVAGIGSLSWFEAIKRINLSKATAIITPYPILSVIMVWTILKETPSLRQIVGLAMIIFGVFILTKIKSEKRL